MQVAFPYLSPLFLTFLTFLTFVFLLIPFVFYLSLSFSTYYLRFLLITFFSTCRGLSLYIQLVTAYHFLFDSS